MQRSSGLFGSGRHLWSFGSTRLSNYYDTVLLLLPPGYWQGTRGSHNLPLDSSLHYDDPRLIQSVIASFLHPPSSKAYHLMHTVAQTNTQAAKYMLYKAEFAYMFCQKAIEELFEGAKPGFFIEAGALDGEFLSNTLPLEEKGWTGLLVEPDGDMFNELISKNRRVWASHSCLATSQHPHTGTLIKYVRQKTLKDKFSNHAARAHGSLLGQTGGATLDGSMPGHPIYEVVQCLPLASLLLAINTTHVDLVSLDVEGAEKGILRHFPWSRVTVDVWVVEHARDSHHKTQDTEFIELFTSKGYEVYRVSEDLAIPNYAFVLRGSQPYRRLLDRRDWKRE